MPAEKPQSIADDIDYMRTLAEEGVRSPLLGGRFALMWGGLVALALLTEWASLTGKIPLEPDHIGLVWLVMSIVGGVLSAILGRTMRGKPGFGSVGNRTSQAVWSAGGLAIFAYVFGIIAAVVLGKGGQGDFDTIMPMAFCVYGIAYFTTGKLSGNSFMKTIAGLSFAATLVTGALMHQPVAYLVAAVFVVLTAVIPGLVLLRAEPATLV